MSLKSLKKSIFISVGSLLLLAGLLFFLIPILPGCLFAFFGLNILSKGSDNIQKNKLVIKYLEFSQKYMNYIKQLIKANRKTVVTAIVFVTMLASMVLNVSPVNASYGLDSSYKQVKTENSPIVYYLDHKQGKKKAYVSEASYLTYGNNWSDIKIVHSEALRAWSDVHLVKSQNKPEIFYIENDTKKWIQTEKEFIKSGYNWNDVVTIVQADLDQYKLVGENPYKSDTVITPQNNNSNYNNSNTQSVLASNSSVNTSILNNTTATRSVGATDNNPAVNKGLTVESINYNVNLQRTLANTNSNLVATYNLQAAGENVSIEKIIVNAEGVFSNNVIRNIYLTIGNDSSTKYEGYSTNGKEIHFDFQHYPINVLSGRDKIIKIYVDFAGDESTNFQTVKFTMNNKNSFKTDSNVFGSFPLQATTFELIYLENILGQATIEELNLDRALEVKIGSVNEEISAFKITETTDIENLKITKLVFENLGSATQEDIENVVLKDSRGKSISQVKKINGQTIEFKFDNYQINKDTSASFSVHADIIKGENKTINLQLKEATVVGDVYEYAIIPNYLDVAESIKIIREQLNVISNDLKVTENVFKKENGTLIGVYEIRNNDQSIVVNSVKVILSKSETAPVLQEAIYLVNYDTGDVYDYARPVYDDFIVLDIPKVVIEARKNIKLALITTIPEKSQQGDRYGSELNSVNYKSVNSGILLEDTVNVPSQSVTVSKSNLFIYENLDAEDTDFIKGEDDVKIASFYLEASYGDDVLINGLTLTKGNTSGLVTYENGFSNLKVKIGNKQVGNTIDKPYSDVYNFNGFSYVLKSGKKVEVSVYVDTSENMKVNSTQLMFSKMTAQSKVSGIEAIITGLNVKSYAINFGETSLAIRAGSNGLINQGENDNFVGSFVITNNGDENVKLDNIALLTTGRGFSNSLGYKNLEIKENESSKRLGTQKTPVSGANKISLGGYVIQKGVEKTFNVYVDGGDYDTSEGFELRFAELTAKGDSSKISVTVSGMPTNPIIVGTGNTFVLDDNDNDDNSNTNNNTNTLELSWPVNGRVTATFHDPNYLYQNQVGNHEGIDIEVSQGTPVKSAQDGVVYSVIDGGEDHTSYIIIDHGNGYRTLYAHLSRMDVSVGDVVNEGDVIGLSGGQPGTYGAGPYTNGPHLHFEVQHNGIAVDPMDYLN